MRRKRANTIFSEASDVSNWEETRVWLERSIPAVAYDKPEDHWTDFY